MVRDIPVPPAADPMLILFLYFCYEFGWATQADFNLRIYEEIELSPLLIMSTLDAKNSMSEPRQTLVGGNGVIVERTGVTIQHFSIA